MPTTPRKTLAVQMAMAETTFGALVAPSGGDFATIQGAIDAEVPFFIVKAGIYIETVLFDNACQKALFLNGVALTGSIQVTGANVSLEYRSGCQLDGVINWDAEGGSLIALNGLIAEVGIDVDADKFHCDLGGFGGEVGTTDMTTRAAINLLGDDNVVMNGKFTHDAGSGLLEAIEISTTGNRNGLFFNFAEEAGASIIRANSPDSIVSGNLVNDTSSTGASRSIRTEDSGAVRCIIVGNICLNNSDSQGINIGSDDCLVNGNTVKEPTEGGGIENIQLSATFDDILAYANRTDGAITNLADDSTVAGGNTTNF